MNIITAAKLTMKRTTIIASLKRFSLFSISSDILSTFTSPDDLPKPISPY